MLSLSIRNLRSMQLLKECSLHHKFGESLILAWLSFSSVSHIPYCVNFRLNNEPNMSSVLPCFLRQFGRYTQNVFVQKYLVLCVREVCKRFLTEVKELRTVFNVFIFCVLKKRSLQILTINLQFYFYQINFIQWFYENGRSKDKIYAIKTNNFESDIFRVRDFYFWERPPWSGDFQQNVNKVGFIFKSAYIATFAENLTL